jgi:putative phosphoesterase
MRIGVVSDTHGVFDPALRRVFAGVDVILHAGDVGSEEVLDELRQIAPVHAVCGNVDGPELGLPPSLKLQFDGLQVQMMHILPVPQSELKAWSEAATPGGKVAVRSENFLKAFDESTGIVIFGHSHMPCLVNLGGRLFINPGSAGKQRFSLPRCYGLIERVPEGIQVRTELLDGYPGQVLEMLQMDIEMEDRR